MKLFYDTETTGLTNWRAGPSDPSQPHIVQLAGVLMDDDRQDVEVLNVLVRPDGYDIPAAASDVHGITQEKALADGIPLWQAVWQFERLMRLASLRIAHNAGFDDLVLATAYHRLGLAPSLDGQDAFCTKEATTPILKLPGRYPGKYKWPKLAEAYRYFFDKDIEDAHDALADVRACADVYYALIDSAAKEGAA